MKATISRYKISAFLGYLAVFIALFYYLLIKSAVAPFLYLDQRVLLIFIACLTSIKLIFQRKYNLEIFYTSTIFLIVSIIVFNYSHDPFPMILSILLFSANDLDFDEIARITYITIAITLVTLIGLTVLGLIDDYQIIRYGVIRHALGTSQPTIFSSMCFFAMAAYIYYKRNVLKYYHFLIFGILILLVNHITASRNDTLSIVMLLLVPLIVWLINFRFIGMIIKLLMVFSYPIYALSSFVLSFQYQNNSGIYFGIDLDNFLAGRLYLGSIALKLYHVKLFGQQIIMNGNGNGGYFINSNDYFFIDSSYLYMLLRYGIVFIVLYLALSVFLMYRLISTKNYFLAAIIAIVGFEATWQLTLPQYLNIFALCLGIYEFSLINRRTNKRIIKRILKMPKVVWSK